MYSSSWGWLILLIVLRILFILALGVGYVWLRREAKHHTAAPLIQALIGLNGLALLCTAFYALLRDHETFVIVAALVRLTLADADFIGLLLLALIPLSMTRHAAFAVLRRNFISYFSTPLGYIFLCLFVWLTSIGAFWPGEFFNANMATLHVLNYYLPLVMLLFIPAITMSVWAEERRQGTDELLLTIPADDFDIVLGKYLSAGAIFTASLLFSQFASFLVLNILSLGSLDIGLFFTTYLGYWILGLAMLSIGMIASFLSGNLTVAFILGVLMNAPLVFLGYADLLISDNNLAQMISRWSVGYQFEDFGRGVISLSSVAYFFMLIALGIYVSMVLIGRRHWLGGRDGNSMLGHYLGRSLALAAFAVAASVFFTQHDWREDTTTKKLSQLSPSTVTVLSQLDLEKPVLVEAFISNELPEEYVEIRYDLITMLRELRARGGGNLEVKIHDNMEPFSDEAKQAEERYGVRPQTVQTVVQDTMTQKEVFLAAVFTCGLERVVNPFFGRGSSVEYELVRSIATVAAQAQANIASRKNDSKKEDKTQENNANQDQQDQQEEDPSKKNRRLRPVIGVVRTDAQIMGTDPNDFMAMMQRQTAPRQLILEEIEKQYVLESIDPNTTVNVEDYDVMILAQPSSLTDPQLDNMIGAIESGLPTLVFEDPLPYQFRCPGTDQPKQPTNTFGRMQPPPPKCNLKRLWDVLGVKLLRAQQGELVPGATPYSPPQMQWRPFTAVMWDEYNPYRKVERFPDVVIFANPNSGGEESAFNTDQAAVSGFEEVGFVAAGAIQEYDSSDKTRQAKKLDVIPLVRLGANSGIQAPQAQQLGSGQRFRLEVLPANDHSSEPKTVNATLVDREMTTDTRLPVQSQHWLAARIQSKSKKKEEKDKEQAGDSDAPETKMDVVLIADLDVLASLWKVYRDNPQGPIDFKFQNFPFILNLVDSLAGDARFLDIRKRIVRHPPLRLIDDEIRAAEERTQELIKEKEEDINEKRKQDVKKREAAIETAQKELDQANTRLDELAKQQGVDTATIRAERVRARDIAQQKLGWQQRRNKAEEDREEEQFTRELQRELRRIRNDFKKKRQDIQSQFKVWAVLLPPIPPFLVALAVFAQRRLREREGVSRNRLR